MRLISSEFGQSLQLVVMDEIRPLHGGIFLPDLVSEIVQRYRFATPPAHVDPAQSVKFQTGVLEVVDVTIPVVSLELYHDGVVVGSRNTEDADAILDDFVSWSTHRFKLREPITKIPRSYLSSIVVTIEDSLDGFVSQFQQISGLLSKAFGSNGELHLTRLSIGPLPPGQLPFRTTWNIEPRTDQPFVPNRYFSSAPLPTNAHVALLGELENMTSKFRRNASR